MHNMENTPNLVSRSRRQKQEYKKKKKKNALYI